MEKIALQIQDFPLLFDTVQNMTKISGNLKITVDRNGFKSSLADDNEIVRMDVTSDSMRLDGDCGVEKIDMCTKNLQMISQLLMKINKAHVAKLKKKDARPNFSDVRISVDDMQIFMESSTLKTNVYMDNESAVHVLRPFTHELHPIAEVESSIEDIKDVLSTTVIFKQPDKITVEVCHQDDMVRNIAYAYMSDPSDPRTNGMVMKFGNIISGDFTRQVLLDIPRLKYLSMFPFGSMKFTFNKEPCFCVDFESRAVDSFSSTQYRIISKYVLPRQTLN